MQSTMTYPKAGLGSGTQLDLLDLDPVPIVAARNQQQERQLQPLIDVLSPKASIHSPFIRYEETQGEAPKTPKASIVSELLEEAGADGVPAEWEQGDDEAQPKELTTSERSKLEEENRGWEKIIRSAKRPIMTLWRSLW